MCKTPHDDVLRILLQNELGFHQKTSALVMLIHKDNAALHRKLRNCIDFRHIVLCAKNKTSPAVI